MAGTTITTTTTRKGPAGEADEKVPATKTGQSGIFSRFGGWHLFLFLGDG